MDFGARVLKYGAFGSYGTGDQNISDEGAPRGTSVDPDLSYGVCEVVFGLVTNSWKVIVGVARLAISELSNQYQVLL